MTDPTTALAPIDPHKVRRTAFEPTSQGGVEYQAKLLASATVIPKMFQNNMGNVMVAMDFALRLGMSPFSVMSEMYEVKGKPQFSGKFMAAIVVASGEFGRLRYKLRRENGSVVGCMAYTTELATGREIEGTEVTWDMVTKEGWNKDTKDKYKNTLHSKWNTMREQMFKYRAAAFFVRGEVPDLALGVQTKEEGEDLMANGTIVEAEMVDDQPDLPSAADAYRASPRESYDKAVQPIADAMKRETVVAVQNKHYNNALGVWERYMDGPFDDEVIQGYMDNLESPK